MNSFKLCADAHRVFWLGKRAVRYFYLAGLLCFSMAANSQIQFENTTTSIGGPFHIGESWGAAWGHMDEDVYPDLFVNNHAMLASLLRNNGDGTFSDNVEIADLEQIWISEPNSDTHGGGWADFDNDGDQDLFVTRSSVGARFHLFENNGAGFFEEKGGQYGIGANGGGRMPVLFDYTNDGRLDLMLAKNGGEGKIFKWNVNNFTEQTVETGLSGLCNTTFGGFASDLFDTGSLDFICLAESSIPFGAYNTATIPFTDISSSIDSIGTNSDAVLADFNNDLKMDLVATRGVIRPSGVKKISDQRIESWMSVGGSTNFEKSITFSSSGSITVSIYARNVNEPSYVNIGASAYNPSSLPVTLDPNDSNNWGAVASYDQYAVYIEFDEVAQEWTITLSTGGSGSEGAYIVVDGSGFTEPTISGLTSIDLPLTPKFLLNDGTRLVDSDSRGIGSIMCGGIASADFDNDMDIDLYLTCRTSLDNLENRLYLNDGTGMFSLDTGMNGAQGLIGAGIDGAMGTAENALVADYDVDGFMDLFVTNGNRLFPHFVQDGFSGGGPDQFYRNLGGNGNHWLEIDLEGVASNRDGFGAKVIVTSGGISQLREQNGKNHRWSHDHKRLHFGLAANTTADVTIEWPDGTTDLHTGVAADKLYHALQGGSFIDITPDPSAPRLSIDTDVSVSEGDSVILTVNLSSASSSAISVDYQTIDNDAVGGVDYIAASGTLTFAPNELTKTLTFSTLTNTELEPNEMFVVSMYNSAGVVMTQPNGVITIEEVGGQACGEPDYSLQSDRGLFVWRDCGNTDNWFFRATAGGGTQAIYDGNLIASSAMSSLTTYSFEGSDLADLSNFDERLDFYLKMSNSGEDGFEFALPYGEDLCLTLDDPGLSIFIGAKMLPFTSVVNLANVSNVCLPSLSISDVIVSESAGSVDMTVTMSDLSVDPVSVSFVSSDGTATAGFDYSSVSGSLTIAPNDISGVITIPVLQDADVESLEDFTVTLSNSTSATILDGNAVVSIDDDELTACGEPTYNSSIDAGLFVWQDCGGTDQWHVRTTAGGGSEVYIGAFTASTAISSIIPFSFESSDFATLIAADKVLDFSMTMANSGQDGIDFTLSLGSELCLTLNDPNQVIYVGVDKTPFLSNVNLGNVTGVCAASFPTLSVADVTVTEGGGSVDVNVVMSNISASVMSVSYASSDGSAINGLDYTAVSGTLDIQPNDTSGLISIPILQDTDVESLEGFTVTLSNPINADILDGVATVSIDDDELTACGEPMYTPSIDAGLFVWQDCDGDDQWHVRTTAGGGSEVYIGAFTASTAISSIIPFSFESSDFATLSAADKILDFKMTMVNSGQDGIGFTLALGSELCLTLDDPNQVIYVGVDKTPFLSNVNLVNVTGTCAASFPTLSVADVTVSEAAGSIDVSVMMSNVSANVVSVSYATSDGSATNGLDYTSVSGVLDIQPNATIAVITIPVIQDTNVEALEDFTITLSNPVNADILDGVAIVSIDDDELTACGEPTYDSSIEAGLFIWQDCGATEQWFVRTTAGGGTSIVYTGSLVSDAAISSVNTYSYEGIDSYSLSNADKELDFLMKMSGVGVDGLDLVLPANSQFCLSLDDPNQVIYVGVDKTPFLSTVNLANVSSVCSASLPTLSIADISVSEGAGSVDVIVTMSNVSTNPVSVSYVTSDGTAINGLDYTAMSGTLLIPANNTNGLITIPILQDAVVESIEDFTVTLSNSVDADILDGNAIVSIDDDETTACGEPSYASSTDASLFVWQDCGGSEQWYVRATAGGGSALIYTGSVVSDSAITMLTTFSFEGIDSYSFSNSNQDLSFLMKMAGNGTDGIQFSLAPGASCLDVTLPANTSVVVGQDNAVIVPPFDLLSLGSC